MGDYPDRFEGGIAIPQQPIAMILTNLWARTLIGIAGALGMLFLIVAITPPQLLIPEDLRELLRSLSIWNEERPEDKVYLHLDRPFYKPGETVWFTAYVRDGHSMRPSAQSDIVHVELIDPKGAVMQNHQLLVRNGMAKGDFTFTEAAPGGLYKVKAYTEWMNNEEDPAIFEKDVQVQAVVTPRVKMNLDFVREAYAAGATVQADVTFEDLANQPLAHCEVRYLLQVEGETVREGNATTDGEGNVRVSAQLPDELGSPDALLLVLMNHQGIMESISRSVPVVLDQIDISFFPEGGDLVEGLPGTVAFSAVNAYGEPADVTGVVLNEGGEVVTHFSSYHKGMGAFDFTPNPDESYTVALAEPFVTDAMYPLPVAMRRGYTLHVDSITEHTAILNIHSTETERLSVVGTVRGEAYFALEYDLTKGSKTVEVNLDDFPMGVAQFTLFDSRTIPRAERLAFVNRHRQMKIELSTNKEKYLPREEVKLNIRTLDDRGMPLPAQVSMAVVDDRLRSFADDRSSTILSWMLVESDIRGEVEEPRFYFDPVEKKAEKALDYLLMTAGWRRFTWRQISQQNLPSITHLPEQTRVKGTLLDLNGLPLAGARIEADGMVTQTNRQGIFDLRNLDLYEPVDVIFSVPGREETYVYRVGEYRDDLNIQLGRKKGRVLDENGEPLPGVTVVVEGTSMGAFTDENGEYTLPLASEGNKPFTLVVSYLGYEREKIPFSNVTDMQAYGDITLQASHLMLEEVVVTGFARTRSERTMKASSAIQGRVQGVQESQERRRLMEAGQPLPPNAPAPQVLSSMVKEAAMVERDLALDEDVGLGDAPLDKMADMEENIFDGEIAEGRREGMQVPEEAPVIQEILMVDEEAHPVNLNEVRRQIGYPQRAREAAIEGEVIFRVLVDERGRGQQYRMMRSVHPLLDRAVRRQLPNLQFVPTIQEGRPTATWVNVPFHFRLHNNSSPDQESIFLGSTAISSSAFYRAREFAAPAYVQRTIPKRRTDFRNTLHWEGAIETDRRGEAEISFYTSDALTSFHITVEGIGMDGSIGRSEYKFFSQLPFELDLRVPPVVSALDQIQVPLTLINHTDERITGPLTIKYPDHLIPLKDMPEELTLNASESRTILLPCRVDTLIMSDSLEVDFRSFGFADAMVVPVRNAPRGFPASQAFTSEDKDARFTADLSHAVPGSIRMWFNAFPTVNGEVLEGLEGMLREPSGCFEQTSSTTYPNVLALAYLEETDQDDRDIRSRAINLIAKGYNRLMTFKSPSGGFEWFGGDPGHEGLTAYGLMEFVDMSKVYEGVDQKMIDRTAEWLLSRRDGEGGFVRNPRALHYFGLSDDATTSIYITYALTEAGFTDLEKEIDFAYETAMETKEPYQMALAANLLLNVGEPTRAQQLLDQLIDEQKASGLWESHQKQRSAPGSQGQALDIEVTGLALTALLRTRNFDRRVAEKAADWLRSQRNSYGSFGNTHSTVLALRALIDYAIASKTPPESGDVDIFVGGKLVASRHFDEVDTDPILMDGLEEHLTYGTQDIRVRYRGVSEVMPYTLSMSWATDLPPASEDCAVEVEPTFTTNSVKMGETLRLTVALRNNTDEGQPMIMAIVGIPGGLSAQPWQLKEMVERKQVDFYEIIGQDLVLYYRQMAPSEEKVLNFDLKAEVPGQYMAQASRAYLYYTDEHKHWAEGAMVEVRE